MPDTNLSVYENLDILITEKLLNNASLFNHVYWVKQDLELLPHREHILGSVNFTDITSRKDDFIKELFFTIVAWIYGKKKQKELFDMRFRQSNDYGIAASFLLQQAKDKFRKDRPQGQFGELLLFNFLQKFFSAVPLLRKMPITTSPSMERFGADAIHVAKNGNNVLFFIGEAKCYISQGKFSEALKDGIDSVVKTFNNFFKEMNLYTYDDFLDEDLKIVAQDLKEGRLQNVKFELVCIIIYNENKDITADSEQEIKANIINTITKHCHNFDKQFFNRFKGGVINRINYILFPVWELDKILADFNKQL